MDALVAPSRSCVSARPPRELRRRVSSALALLVLVGLVACALRASSFADHELLQAAEIIAASAPAEMEAMSVKNAAVKSAVSNNRLMGLIRQSQQSNAVSLSSVEAVRSLSDNDLSVMIKNAESHITTAPEVASDRRASLHSVTKQVAATTANEVTAVTPENAGNLDLKAIASAFEAHLLQEESAAKALMAHDLGGKTAAQNPPAPDMMSTMKAQLNKEEKDEEDKMNEHFSKEREETLKLFHNHISAAAPSAPERVAHPAPSALSPHSSPSPRSRKSLANLHMIEHLVSSNQDSVNDVQYGAAPQSPSVSVADRLIARLRDGTSDADNDAQYGVSSDVDDPTKGRMPSWISKLRGGSHERDAPDGDKGLTWRKNYLSRLQKVGYKHDEFASTKNKAPLV